ncbi:MAG: response regulator transcription factor [Verrucomicrobia bacterium]|nr:response regulator transcription factor [Verrucomicrobiota bacterium]
MKFERILIIEDDPTMLRVLKDNFEFSGYNVRIAVDGIKGFAVVHEFEPDLLLLDIMLPGMNGFELCRRLRKEGSTIPIIMLTAKGQESDVVLGLNTGADDYVTKPFSIDVLLARVKARLRTNRERIGTEAAFGDCKLDFASHKLFRNGTEIVLTPKEFRLLKFLIEKAGRALTRDQILDGVWGRDLIVTQRSVDRCVTTLRNKVEPDPHHPAFIQTIRDVGYRFEGLDAQRFETCRGPN